MGDNSLILLVDDDKSNLKRAQEILQDDYRIAAAISGEQAIKYLENNIPDLILLDIIMPQMDGFETLEKIRKIAGCESIPVIFLTAQDDADTEAKGFELGADDFIRKPFVDNIVLKRVRRSIESAHLRNNLAQEVKRQTRNAETRKKELEKLSIEVIQTLATTIDTKDIYTKGHSSRVSDYSVLLAKKLGWDKERIEALRMMALLHDVGKISVPDRILNKPGRLENDEFEIIKSHTIYGHSILQGISGLSRVSEVARHHHERFDGKGYPDGLSGEAIAIEARVVGIADSYDAMSSDRVYRKALPKNIIREELIKGRGTQFDPELLDVFLEMFDGGELDIVYEETTAKAKIIDPKEIITNALEGNVANTDTVTCMSDSNIDRVLDYIESGYSSGNNKYKNILIKLEFEENDTHEPEHLQRAMTAMEYSILQCLRKTDITCRISDMQHIVMLDGEDEDYLSSAVERIFSGYYKNCLYAEIKPSYLVK